MDKPWIWGRLPLGVKTREKVSPSATDERFLSEEEIKNAAVKLALRGVHLQEGLEHLEIAHSVKERAAKEQYEPELYTRQSIIEQYQGETEKQKSVLEKTDEKNAQLRTERYAINDKIQELRFRIYITVQEVRKKRLEKEKELFEKEEDNLRSAAIRNQEELVEGLENQIEIAKKLYAVDKVRWEINRPEYERRVESLTKEKERVEDQLYEWRKYINNLRELGITRTTSNFLIWAGYASIAGVGGVIANLLQGGQQAGADYISLLFQYLSNMVKSLQSVGSFWDLVRSTLLPFGVLIGIIATTGALVFLTDILLKYFDRSWPGDLKGNARGNKRARSKGKGKGGNSGSGEEESRRQIPFLTPEINRLTGSLPEVNRRSYIKLLALLPYLFLASAIVVLSLSGTNQLAPPSSGSGQPSSGTGPAGLSITYIGIVFTLLSVSVSVLYSTKVIEPRLRKLSEVINDQDGSEVSGSASGGALLKDNHTVGRKGRFYLYLKAHWEFIAIMLSMTLALVLAAVLPSQNRSFHLIWGTIAIFMCFSSMALAYGIVHKGIFRDIDFMEGKRYIYRSLIERYSTQPTIVDIFESVDPNEVKEVIANYRKSRQDLDELRLLYELKRHFADNYMEDKDILKYWSTLKKWSSPLGFLKNLPFKKFEPAEPDLIDYEIAPDETRAINQYREDRLHSRSKLDEIAMEMTELEKARIESRNRLRELETKIAEKERERTELKQSYEQEKIALTLQREKDCLAFKEAYSIGEMVAAFIKD
jgi:hypothetical protein